MILRLGFVPKRTDALIDLREPSAQGDGDANRKQGHLAAEDLRVDKFFVHGVVLNDVCFQVALGEFT